MNIITSNHKFVMPEPNTGCWLWIGVASRGYGQTRSNNKTVYAHRLSYENNKGPIGKFDVCHTCDNPSCVNPDHLFLGTAKDNIDDMVRKGRKTILRGDHCGASKLCSNDILIIKMRLSEGAKLKELARVFEVRETTISAIKRGINWRHI